MNTLVKGSRGNMVNILQHWLNLALSPSPPLAEDGGFGDGTERAVVQFKQKHGFNPADGRVDPKTWAALGQIVGRQEWLTSELPFSIWKILQDLRTGPLNIRHDSFFQLYAQEYGGLSAAQVGGLARLLRFIDRDTEVKDVRWAAYMLATVKHECAGTWLPIEEYGKGQGHAYGNPTQYKAPGGATYHNVYYGRGYVQLTWLKNYLDLGQACGLGDALAIKPERVLEPELAYAIMSYGMRNGSFTGKKLADYIQAAKCDYVNARRIINGTDQAQRIAGYAQKLEMILRGSVYA
jgi:hypothetical protein